MEITSCIWGSLLRPWNTLRKRSCSTILSGIAMMLSVMRRTRELAMRCHAAWALWFLGQPDQALDRIQEALTLARELSEPHGLAHAFFFAAILHQLRREERMAQEHAEAAIAVSSEHGLVLYQATGDD